MDNEACPVCYRVWWEKRHPNVNIVMADDSVVFAAQQRIRELERNAAQGMVSVPAEPTQEMLEAGAEGDCGQDDMLQAIRDIYKAMLAARPK